MLRGIITGNFGKQSHPTLPGITFENNGVDISTEAESSVLAVFAGNVSSVFSQSLEPVKPSSFPTVPFERFTAIWKAVRLKKGDRIEAREKIGTVRPNNGQHVLHFEVWKVAGVLANASESIGMVGHALIHTFRGLNRHLLPPIFAS